MGRKQPQGFDDIIIGAGSAGGLLRFRLWQNPDIRILLIEAGSGDHHWSIRMRVHGIAGLRVADASVMPAITTGNINVPSMRNGERAAELIATANQH